MKKHTLAIPTTAEHQNMLTFLPPLLKGVLSANLLLVNTLVMCCPLLFLSLFKLIIPVPAFRQIMSHFINSLAEGWISCNSTWMRYTQKLDYTVEGFENLDPNGWYLVIANHQSWADITIMQHLLNKKIPLMKFFLKKELIWVPILGLCWWALDLPFMKRYSKTYLKKHPEKKGQDLAITRKACEKFKKMPVSIVNYLEGTRFTKTKHQLQQSPFQYLLKPRAGGISFVIDAMGHQIRNILNITIHYHQPNISYWDFLCGRIEQVTVHAELIEISVEFIGKDYQNDSEFRTIFQQWVNALWQEKELRLQSLANKTRRAC